MSVGSKRVAVFSLVLLALVGGGLFYWEMLRPRRPAVDGEIPDDAATVSSRLCVRGAEPPCRSVEAAEAVLASPLLEPVAAEEIGDGNQGILALLVEGPEGERFRAKWRGQRTESIFSVPALELVAYRLQRELVAPVDYVLPPTAAHCFDHAQFEERVVESPTLQGTDCVFGFLSLWIDEGHAVDEARARGLIPEPTGSTHPRDPMLYDAARFSRDGDYQRSVSIVNVIAYLTQNRDAHVGQFVFLDDPWHAFLIDSSLSFSVPPSPMTFVIQDLSNLLVPAIPRDVAARLRALTRRDVDSLRVASEFRVSDGRLEPVPASVPFDETTRLRRQGDRLQVGATRADVDGVWDRVTHLRDLLESGALDTFD